MTCCFWYDHPKLYTEIDRRARIFHKCCECGAMIVPGEVYQVIKGCWNGEFYEYKTCMPCADLRAAVTDATCTFIGRLKEAYMHYLRESDAARYDAGARRWIYPENHMKLNK